MTQRAFILYLVEAPNGKRYVGITSRSIADRWFEHLQESRCSRANRAISNAIRKYGAVAFTIKELDRASSWQELCQKERAAIQQFNTFAPAGYNVTRGGDGFTGKHTAETIAKMRVAHLGKIKTTETRKKLSIAHTGKKIPPEVIAKGVAKRRARPRTDAERRGVAIMQAKNVGRTHTAESRKRMADARRAVGNPKLIGHEVSAETRAKISKANTGRIASAEHRAKIGAAHRGKIVSAASRARMSAGMIGVNKGRKHSPETCEKNRLAHIGMIPSAATRAKRAESMRLVWIRRKSQTIDQSQLELFNG